MKGLTTDKGRYLFDKYLNEQMKILKGHHERIMLRIWNKFMQLKLEEMKE
jgi:hypothetical protein